MKLVNGEPVNQETSRRIFVLWSGCALETGPNSLAQKTGDNTVKIASSLLLTLSEVPCNPLMFFS